jgi:hypothetical protein
MTDIKIDNMHPDDIPTDDVQPRRKCGRPPKLREGKYIQSRPVMAVRMDPSLRDQIIKVARLTGTNPNRLMQRILLEGLNP